MPRDPEEVRARWVEVEPLLRAAAPRANWMAVRSPLLPTEWPPTRRTRWVRYHYGAGAEPGLMDAVRVSSPHVIEHVDRNGRTTRVEAVAGSPAVSTQGVRPLSGALDGPDPRIVERAALALHSLPLTGSEEERLLRGHYRQWLSTSGATAEILRPRHAEFLHWLESQKSLDP